jgi:hypothetical protein
MAERFGRNAAVNSLVFFTFFLASHAFCQFIDNFNDTKPALDPKGLNGWMFFTGDGTATMSFTESGDGYASINVDATKDRRGIWWALIKRCVSQKMDLRLLRKPKHELRVEARVRLSNCPKRVNLSLNTNRTKDFHSNLMEFDIDDTTNWHTISYTTRRFDAAPGDTVYGQLALMDWGLKQYRIDIDYFRVDIVNTDTAGPDKGVQVPYHPPIDDPFSFDYHIPAAEDGIIDLQYPDVPLRNWSAKEDNASVNLLTVGGTQFVILRWDLKKFAGRKAKGSGVLELTTYSLQRSTDYQKDFGMVGVSEIIGGDPKWIHETVTYDRMTQGKPLDDVVNSQMVIDVDINPLRTGRNLITISNPVLQRLIDGKTLGLAIEPLGAVIASFYSIKNGDENIGPELDLNVELSPPEK